MAEMRRLTAYFGQFHEGTTWETAEPIFDELFHPDVVIVGKEKQWDYQGWKEWYKTAIQEGLVIDMEKIVKEAKTNTIVYTISVRSNGNRRNNGNDVLHHTAKGIFQDGKLIRTEPVDPSIYDKMTKPRRKPVQIL